MESYLPQLLTYSGRTSAAGQTTAVADFIDHLLKLSKGTAITHSDIHWLNLAGEAPTIAQVRQLQTEAAFQPYQLPHSVFVVWAIDGASVPAQNALLKLLEEPPKHVVLILTARHLGRVLPTIQSRVATQPLPITDSEAELSQIDPESSIGKLYERLTQASYGQLVELAEAYPDVATGREVITQLIDWLSHQLHGQSSYPAPQITAHLQVLLTGLDWLDHNVNPKLAVTETWFQLKRKLPILPPSTGNER